MQAREMFMLLSPSEAIIDDIILMTIFKLKTGHKLTTFARDCAFHPKGQLHLTIYRRRR